MKSKSKVLTIFAILCFGLGVLELFFGGIILAASTSTELLSNLEIDANLDEIKSLDLSEYNINLSEFKDEDIIQAIIIIMGGLIFVEGTFFIIEGFLIRRASKNGKKTRLLSLLLMIGIFSQIIALIRVACHHNYDFNSASRVVSLVLKAIILKYVLEVRRIDKNI